MPGEDEDGGRFSWLSDALTLSTPSDPPDPVTFHNIEPQDVTVTINGGDGGSSSLNGDGSFIIGNPPDRNHTGKTIVQTDHGFAMRKKYGDITEGDKLEYMEEATIEEWYLNEGFRLSGPQEVGAAYAGETYEGNGFDAVAHLVVGEAMGRITEALERGNTPETAFNGVTEEWPRKAQARLAWSESERGDRDTFPDYQTDCRNFAEDQEMIGVELGQTQLDLFYPDNPYDSDLTTEEAGVVMVLRANDEDVGYDILDEIDDPSAFAAWYEELRDIELAMTAHEFDSRLPTPVVEQCAPPEDWPDDLDATSVENRRCTHCNDRHFEVFTGNDVTWVHHNGNPCDGERLGDEYLNVGREGFMCEQCQYEWEEYLNRVVVIPEGESGPVCVENNWDVTRVSLTDSEYNSWHGLTSDQQNLARDLANGQVPNDLFGITSDGEFAPAETQRAAMQEMAEPDASLENGTAYIMSQHYPTGMEIGVYLSRTNAKLAQEVKQTLEERFAEVA